MPGIEPGAFHMQSERSTTEPHPPVVIYHTRLILLLITSHGHTKRKDCD